jgi:NADH:ubiquinone oxidoreductase subunit E
MTEPKQIDWKQLQAIVDTHRGLTWALIPLLQEVQEAFGYIPPESIEPIAAALNIFPSQVQGVITFYAGFSLEPKGKYVVRVCRGTACHVKGGRSETSPDYQFTLETVACLGACFLAPTMMINRAYFGRLSPPKVTTIMAEYGKGKGELREA